ncbi:MAG: alpha/beta hydrolase [Betaproteobacteria bacterium]|nr:alpha/beta hydrolase [Betaproteobacteria bacterium]
MTWAGLLFSLGKIALGVVVGLPLVMFFFQDRLIFFPRSLEPARREMLLRRAPAVEEISLQATDGTKLHGWLAKPAASGRFPLVIYFGGNAEETSWIIDDPDRPKGWAWLAMSYRGYGLSEGSPGESALVADARLAYDIAAARPDVDPARIVAYGRSLGSGVAVQLAAARKVAGVILVTPYDSLVSVARHHYPYLPVSFMLRHRFDSMLYAPALDVPLLAIAGERDNIVPPAHAKRLADAWKGPKRYVELRGADHNDIAGHPDFWRLKREFLEKR